MTTKSNTLTVDTLNQNAAYDCYQRLLAMGELNTNPVLLVLGDTESVQQNIKYPKANLEFSNVGIQVFYHSHDARYPRAGEHGHFHYFIRSNQSENRWNHLVVLSMDAYGQAREWQTVNHWVTHSSKADTWQNANELTDLMDRVLSSKPDAMTLLEYWLYDMLLLYREEIQGLLLERDDVLVRRAANRSFEQVLNDRELEVCSSLSIDLLSKLKTCLIKEDQNDRMN